MFVHDYTIVSIKMVAESKEMIVSPLAESIQVKRVAILTKLCS